MMVGISLSDCITRAENNGYTVFDEDTFTFQLDVFADPKVEEVWISSGTLEEGTDATISAIIRNDGTAKALIFEVGLECSGSEVLTTVNPIVEAWSNRGKNSHLGYHLEQNRLVASVCRWYLCGDYRRPIPL